MGRYRMSQDPYENTGDLLAPVGVRSPRLLVVDYRYTSVNAALVTFVDDPPFQFGVRL